MKRREFISLLGGAAAAWPLAARARQMPVIGFLHSQTAAEFAHLVSAFRRGLDEAGYVEGRNVAIEFRWAEGRTAHVPALARELVGRQVAVIVASGGSSFAAKAATATIPIVCSFGGDPVELGLVSSLNRPGGNLTGVSIFTTTLEAKRLEMLHELVPKAALTGVLFDPKILHAERQLREIEAAARALGQPVRILNVSSESDIHAAFAALVEARAGALAVTGNPFLNRKRDMIVALAAQHALPTIYEYREAPVAGGLVSYGPSLPEAFRQIGAYTARILNGEKPGDLPVLQPAKFELVLNLKTAKALGLEIPPTLLARADEVIE